MGFINWYCVYCHEETRHYFTCDPVTLWYTDDTYHVGQCSKCLSMALIKEAK